VDQVLFACHAGPGVGLGHLKRILVAARAIQKNLDLEIDLLVAGDAEYKKFTVGFQTTFTQKGESLEAVIMKMLYTKKYKMLCIDAYEELLTSKFQQVLDFAVAQKIKIVTIDLLSKFTENIDLIYVPSFLEPEVKLSTYNKSKVVFGWDCFLLSLDKPKEKIVSNKVLILTGGSDSTNLGSTWPTILNQSLPLGTKIEWVTGPFSKSPLFPKFPTVDFTEIIAPLNLSLIMIEAKLAATIYGVSFFELLALGVPTVVFNPYGVKNSKEISEIKKLDISLVASDAIEASQMLKTLIRSRSLQKSLASRASNFLKRYSGERFAEEVQLLLRDDRKET